MSREFPKNPEPKNIPLPTVGRIVYYFTGPGAQPMAAIVRSISGDEPYLADLAVFSPFGGGGEDAVRCTHNTPHVEANKDFGTAVGYWDWMPYQKGQAAKTEMLEAQLAAPITTFDHGPPKDLSWPRADDRVGVHLTPGGTMVRFGDLPIILQAQFTNALNAHKRPPVGGPEAAVEEAKAKHDVA